jgi:arsenite methyltransferase
LIDQCRCNSLIVTSTTIDSEDALRAAGLEDIEIDETHRVHEHASSAIVRARRPAG